MSRVSILEQLKTSKRKNALEFHYEDLWAPPIMSLFTPSDIEELRKIATSLRYNGNMGKKYDMIDAVMRRRGFRRAACGTNRVTYNFLEDNRFVAKVALDNIGMSDSPAEYRNQSYFQPFCCRIFEVDPSGVIAFIERVNPISSIEEFISVKDDIFNMMITKIIGKYIVDDLGTKAFMNFGIRMNSNGTAFGPVIIDFPYAYELDGAKLRCAHKVMNKYGFVEECGGEIDYGPGFNRLYCNKCGREYRAMDLAKENNADVRFEYTDEDKAFAKKIKYKIRARIIDNGKTIIDTGRSSNRIISKEEFNDMGNINIPVGEIAVDSTIKKKRQNIKETRAQYYSELQMQYYSQLANAGVFNPVIDKRNEIVVEETERATRDIASYMPPSIEEIYERYKAPEPTMVTEVWATEMPDKSIQIYSKVETLEKATFPELHQVEKDEEVPVEHTISPKNMDNVPVDRSIHNESGLPDKIIPDEVVAQMVQEVKAANNDEEAKNINSTIVDPEADKVAEVNPITRVYADPKNSVLYSEPKENNVPLGPVSASIEEDSDNDETEDEDIISAITNTMKEAASTKFDYSDEDDEVEEEDIYEDEEDQGEYKRYLQKYSKEDKHTGKKLKRFKGFNDSSNLDEY